MNSWDQHRDDERMAAVKTPEVERCLVRHLLSELYRVAAAEMETYHPDRYQVRGHPLSVTQYKPTLVVCVDGFEFDVSINISVTPSPI